MRWPSSSSSTEGARELCIRHRHHHRHRQRHHRHHHGRTAGGVHHHRHQRHHRVIIIIVTMCRQYNGRVEWPPNKQTEERANGLPNQQSFSLTGTKYAPEHNIMYNKMKVYEGERSMVHV